MEETEPGTRLRRHCCGESGPAFTSQKLNGALLLITKARESFPFLKHYANTWPVTDAIICYLANHCKYKKSKNAKKDKAGAGHCQETRTPVTFFPIFLTMDASPFPIPYYISPLCTA